MKRSEKWLRQYQAKMRSATPASTPGEKTTKAEGVDKGRGRKIAPGALKSSGLELELESQLNLVGIPFEREFRFHPARRWRADFAFIEARLLVEVEGGIWTNGRHNRGAGMQGDMEKYNAATELGYRVMRYSPGQIKSGQALEQIERLIARKGCSGPDTAD